MKKQKSLLPYKQGMCLHVILGILSNTLKILSCHLDTKKKTFVLVDKKKNTNVRFVTNNN